MKKQFIPREKLSKKARRALDAAKRQTWAISPVSRKAESKKRYDRKRARRPEDGDGLFPFLWFFHPSATSSTIIIAKPNAAPMVPRFECSPCCASGINSSITT